MWCVWGNFPELIRRGSICTRPDLFILPPCGEPFNQGRHRRRKWGWEEDGDGREGGFRNTWTPRERGRGVLSPPPLLENPESFSENWIKYERLETWGLKRGFGALMRERRENRETEGGRGAINAGMISTSLQLRAPPRGTHPGPPPASHRCISYERELLTNLTIRCKPPILLPPPPPH